MGNMLPKLVVSTGEPAGIGPDVSLSLAFHQHTAEVILLGDVDLLNARATMLGLEIDFYPFDPANTDTASQNGNGRIAVYHVPLHADCTPGTLNSANATYVLALLDTAVNFCLDNIAQGLVTAPVHKSIICQSGIAFTGHTEYLAQRCACKTMMTFCSPESILGLATTHIPVNQISKAITQQSLKETLLLFIHGIQQQLKKPNPLIGVLGLNPHAGESGTIGHEEIDIITPVIQDLQQQGYQVSGPHSGDTAFTPENRKRFDGILAMYHDQGLSPYKALYFEHLVNVTLGLPFVRTSVDHGTALALAGTGKATPRSMNKALECAYHLVK